MNAIKRIKNMLIYNLTNKPSCYIHVDDSKSLQDYRQIQYNNWCKAKGVFNGSYLPYNPETLLKKGWKDISTPGFKKKYPTNFQLQRKSTGQIIRYEAETDDQFSHYHWENRVSLHDRSGKNKTFYLDRYGNGCRRRSKESHLAPYDKEYIAKVNGGKRK